ncbi:MAG: serine hydrolase [Gemmatimonadaceae bacterium]
MTLTRLTGLVLDRVAVHLLRAAAALVPPDRRVWGEALVAELAAAESSVARLRFAAGAALSLLRTAGADALRGRLADPGMIAAALALGGVSAVIDLQSDSRWALRLLLGIGCFALGALRPRAAWRWGVLAALGVPALAAVADYPAPYTYDRGDVWYPLPPAVAVAVLGATFRRRLLPLVISSIAIASPSATAPGQGAPPPGARPLAREDVGAFADSVFASYLRRYAEPSLAVIVVRGDSVIFQRGYGHEDARSRRRVDPESTVFHVASISKLVTATAAMQMVERGRLRLDEDVNNYLRGKRVIEPGGPAITLRHLLTHTSGLDGPFMREVVALPEQLVPLERYFAAHPPRRGRPPGGEVRYSNYAMALAGHLVEVTSGEPFSDYVERHIFAPLGMRHSTLRQPPLPPLAAHVATAGSGPVPDALLIYPAGSMVSTASDMGRFMLAHLNGGRVPAPLGGVRVLADSTTRQMHARQWSADPRLPGVALGFFEGDVGGERGLFHTGARVHFSLLYLLPERHVGIFLVHAMRQGGEFRTLRADFVRGFVGRYFPRPSPTRAQAGPQHPQAAAGRAARFAGVYRPIMLASTTIERAAGLGMDTRVRSEGGGSLSVAVPGGPRLRLVEVDSGLYRVPSGPDRDVSVAFVAAPDGRARRMSLAGGTQDPLSFDRLAWYERGVLHAVILGAAFALFLSCAMAGLVGLVARLVGRLRGRPPPVWRLGERRAWRAALLASTLVALTPITIGAVVAAHGGDDTAANNLRAALTAGLTLLLAGAVFGAMLMPLAVLAWRRRYWSRARRLYYTVLALATAVAIPLLGHYRLLGYWL